MPKHPNAEHMKEHRFEGDGLGIKHGQKPVCVNLPADLDRYVRSKENRSAWMRSVIEAAARAEGWAPTETQPETD